MGENNTPTALKGCGVKSIAMAAAVTKNLQKSIITTLPLHEIYPENTS